MTTSRIIRHITIAVAAFFPGVGIAGESASYKVPPAFTPLPLGEVKPAGWLKDWCQQAAAGITGHSDELDPLFAKGWMDANFKASSTGAQGGDKVVGYAMEQAGYWIDGAVRLARLVDDEKLLAKCHTRFETVLKRVEAGETPVTSKALWEAGEKWGHWPMAIMGRAMLAEYSRTGDKRYLDAIAKNLRRLPEIQRREKILPHPPPGPATGEPRSDVGSPPPWWSEQPAYRCAHSARRAKPGNPATPRVARTRHRPWQGGQPFQLRSIRPCGHRERIHENPRHRLFVFRRQIMAAFFRSWLRGFREKRNDALRPDQRPRTRRRRRPIFRQRIVQRGRLRVVVHLDAARNWQVILRRPHRTRRLQRRSQRYFP